MSKHMLTHGTNIICWGSKENLTEKLEAEKAKLEKKENDIVEYIKGEKLFYKNKEKEICGMEIINVDTYGK